MPAGPIGSCWAPGSWEDTAWEIGSWAGATVTPTPTPTPGSGVSSFDRPERPLPITLHVFADLPLLEIAARLRISPPTIRLELTQELPRLVGQGHVDPDPIVATVTADGLTLAGKGFSLVVPKAPAGMSQRAWTRSVLKAWTGKDQ